MTTVDARLLDTRRAFDGVAAEYDGPMGNNALIRRMRERMWRTLTEVFPPGARLLDLGCGNGIDAVYLAERGLQAAVSAEVVGIHELDRLGGEPFDGIYSDLGPLNCVPNLPAVARACARLLKPDGRVVASAIGRVCPWEFCYYAARGRWSRARVRGARQAVPVGLSGETVWTRYFTPREFYRAFAADFALTRYRALGLFQPPPYLIGLHERARPLCTVLGWLDDRLGALPLARDAGDHFLIVMTRRAP